MLIKLCRKAPYVKEAALDHGFNPISATRNFYLGFPVFILLTTGIGVHLAMWCRSFYGVTDIVFSPTHLPHNSIILKFVSVYLMTSLVGAWICCHMAWMNTNEQYHLKMKAFIRHLCSLVMVVVRCSREDVEELDLECLMLEAGSRFAPASIIGHAWCGVVEIAVTILRDQQAKKGVDASIQFWVKMSKKTLAEIVDSLIYFSALSTELVGKTSKEVLVAVYAEATRQISALEPNNLPPA